MTEAEQKNMEVENALLRATLFLNARALKDYYDSRHTSTEDGFQLTVPLSLRVRASEALVRADKILKSESDQKERSR
jgi:hypothetical protein